MINKMIFYKRINGQVVDRKDLLFYFLKMWELKKEGNWNNENIKDNKN